MNRWLQIAVVVIFVGVAAWAYAQAPGQFSRGQADANPAIISGSDIGFRVDRDQTQTLGKLTGTWVVRVNGQWIEPQETLRGRPLSTR